MARLSRRRFLGATVAVGAGGLLAACARGTGESADTTGESRRSPWDVDLVGEHQWGITTPAPAAATMIALDGVAATAEDLGAGFRSLTEEVRRLGHRSDGRRDGEDPIPPVNVIVSVGMSLFDDRYGLAGRAPRELMPMPEYANDRVDTARAHGDVLLTISGDHRSATDAAARQLLDAGGHAFTSRWKLDGGNERDRAGDHPRNAMGFLEGTSNPDPTDEAPMRQFVWVRPRDDEPDWAVGGSYHAVRVIRMFLEDWDRTDTATQEAIIGRRKRSGAPLAGGGADDVPDYSEDPDGTVTPLDAHIRLANPRDRNIEYDSILRRGFSYSRGQDDDGRADRGLAFVSFQRSLRKGFLAIQERLDGEPLERFTRTEGGGFYFALPGVFDGDDWLGRSLLQPV